MLHPVSAVGGLDRGYILSISSSKKTMTTTTAESPTTETESPLSVLFADLDGELATTRRMLERVPNGHDDYRPHEKSRSLGQLATHLAQLPGDGEPRRLSIDFA